MKKNKLTLIKKVLCPLVFLGGFAMQAQLHNNGSLYVASGAGLYVNDGAFTFGAASSVTTSKTLPYNINDGKIVLGGTAVFTTDGALSKFINGYAEIRSNSETLLAIGSGTTYAPVKVLPSTSTGVHATYVNASPLTAYSGGLDASVVAIANTEYWIIKGDNSKITLSWRAGSNLSSIPFADLTIAGYRNGKWESVPSAIDETSKFGGTSSLSGKGSITSSSTVNLNLYDAFAIGEKGISCAELLTSSGNIKIWDGSSWIGGVPTLNDPVQLNAAYTNGSFSCNSLNFNGFNVSLPGSETLEVVYGFSGVGKVVMSSVASLVQRDKNAAAPLIELTKTTRAIKRFDYVYWGAPISGNVFSQLASAQVPANAIGAFDNMYSYVSGVLGASGGWQTLTATSPGKGFITRVKEQAPFIDGTTTSAINLKFTGTANNGDVTVTVANVSGNTTSSRNNNLLSNPYPSAIDADKFLTLNNDLLDGVIYLWRANTANESGTSNYSNADYIAYTKAGSTAYTGTGSSVGFDGKIASGQGFKVKAIASGNVLFTNCMRVVGNNTQFFRINEFASSSHTDVNRFKVNLQTNDGVVNQVLVAYLQQSTLQYDKMYDAELFTVNPTKIYTLLDNNNKKLAINARPNFQINDQVQLGFTKSDTSLVNMSINLADKEGVFANNEIPIYLHDTYLNLYHNFSNGAYSFSTNEQEVNNRFKIVYQTSTLDNEDLQINNAFAKIFNSELQIEAKLAIEQVSVFDITGRLIFNTKPNILSTSFSEPFNQSEGVYLVKIHMTNGQIVTSKLINKI